MKETPIIYSTDMVRAYLEGRKTMTRRVIKPQPFNQMLVPLPITLDTWGWFKNSRKDLPEGRLFKCPYGQVGDKLWVKETWALDLRGVEPDSFERLLKYRADRKQVIIPKDKNDWYDKAENKEGYAYLWRPSIFMPRWASRITQTITGIRIERLQEITNEDAKAEGVEPLVCGIGAGLLGDNGEPLGLACHYIAPFKELWDSLNAKRGYSWDTNPWVWGLSYPAHQAKEKHG